MDAKRSEYINGLRNLAQLLEDCPNLPTPGFGYTRFDSYFNTKEELMLAIKEIGGKFEKKPFDSIMAFEKHLNASGNTVLHLNINRQEVCERVVTGKKMVASVFIPEHEEEIVEWNCTSVLAPEPLETALKEAVSEV